MLGSSREDDTLVFYFQNHEADAELLYLFHWIGYYEGATQADLLQKTSGSLL
jgi:hypothetical protein